MSEAQFKHDFDAMFFNGWAAAVGGLNAIYTAPGGTALDCDVLVDTHVDQFGDDGSPVSGFATLITFRRAQIEPESGGEVAIDGKTWTLVQRVASSDESLSRWVVQP